MSKPELAQYLAGLFHRTIMHHVLWFTEVRHQMGHKRAMQILDQVVKTSSGIQIKRISKVLGFELKDGLPASLADMPEKKLKELVEAASVNWLANDGIWFQAVENTHGMNEAKRCNDSSWAQFSPVEADLISRMLDLPENPGLEGLKKALGFRLYANVNTQSIIDEGESSFVFQMNDCRVQSARKRRNLPDYPCKSAGLVEYSYFARAIDPRIKTECLGCPPDVHPEEWYCAWRFYLD
ncbi:MAG: DUF6125 family protein [Desulfobacteraceae bacterium]|nr:DUF6125 family protein [Desulfobacteraceae bacterium]